MTAEQTLSAAVRALIDAAMAAEEQERTRVVHFSVPVTASEEQQLRALLPQEEQRKEHT